MSHRKYKSYLITMQYLSDWNAFIFEDEDSLIEDEYQRFLCEQNEEKV